MILPSAKSHLKGYEFTLRVVDGSPKNTSQAFEITRINAGRFHFKSSSQPTDELTNKAAIGSLSRRFLYGNQHLKEIF
ncbi:unnamed protein product [Lactuca virosa]|uniref:Uncharacterized protein n=1 Tax=Lactuca virosa TaxID=75947 RepID=A0AAU9PAY9_9ASTR|nr:unnamed protein product [Lactuca virosa]